MQQVKIIKAKTKIELEKEINIFIGKISKFPITPENYTLKKLTLTTKDNKRHYYCRVCIQYTN